MKAKLKLTIVLYLLAGILFSIAAIKSKNYVFIPIYFCIIVFCIKKSINKYDDK